MEVIIRTNDGGYNWSTQNSGTSQNLWAVAFSDANIGTAVGNGGIILRTVDGGNNWLPQTSGTSLRLNGIYFSDDNNGVVVGSRIILRTVDGGTNWVDVSPAVTPVLYGVHFGNVNNGAAVGENGTILRTTDGGATWSSEVSGTTEYLLDVFFLNGSSGFAVGIGGTILRYNGTVDVEDENNNLTDFTLVQNYPNPFNPSTRIRFSIPESAYTTLKVYSILGQEVATLLNEEKSSGVYEVNFDGLNLSSGTYIYKLKAGNFSETKKMILLK